jgi:hypothetical protein
MKAKFGKGFAKAMAGVGAAAAAATGATGWAGEAQSGANVVTVTSSGGAGATVSVTGVSSSTKSTGPGNTGSVVVVGRQVWIDGEAIPEETEHYVSASGRQYRIHRENGRVSVNSDTGKP